ncbi:MAG: M81 family metallopeptidase [Deltaproteobacteria bacterium]
MIGTKFGRGGRPLRIAYARIFHEGNAFSPLATTQKSFEDFHAHEGEALAAKCTLRGHELEGFLREAELSGFVAAAAAAGDVETVPLVSFMTVPSGKLAPECFQWIRDRLATRMKSVGEVDAVYLALHGSMQVEGLDEAPEGVLIRDVKTALAVPVGASFDLHGNLAPSIADPLTVLTAYRTNPHRDLFQTGFRAGTRLIRALRGHIRPTHAWRKLPMLIGGGTTVDFMKPMRGVFREMRRLEKRAGVVSVHLFMVHPFNDAKDLGWAVHVTTDDDPALADHLADELAERVFALRHEALPPFVSAEEALAEVKKKRLAKRTGTISLVDTCDVVGAGSPGGNTHLLGALLADQTLRVYVPVHDAAAVDACWNTPLGTEVDLVVRGVDTGAGEPEVPIHAVVAARCENESGRVVRLDVGTVSIAVTERLPLTIAPRFWREIDLSPWQADAIVQKTFFHYRFFYVAVNRGNIPVASAGPTSFTNFDRLTFDLPVWPQANVEGWRDFDRARRAVEA